MHRADAHCHWCGEVKSTWLPTSLRVDSSVWRTAAAMACMLTVAGGVWRYAPEIREAVNAAGSSATIPASSPDRVGGRATAVVVAPALGLDSTASEAAVIVDSSTTKRADESPNELAGEDIRWTPAVARTWVNVRSDASRGGAVVGVIKPAARAMLGTDRAGWRQVRSPDVSGWVDPRLFEADSLRTRSDF